MSNRISQESNVKEPTISLCRKSKVLVPGRVEGYDCWVDIMRKFTEANKEKCTAKPHGYTTGFKEIVRPTGSTYTGSWSIFGGMSGPGVYVFPNRGVTYEGQFEDGELDGEGELRYDTGAVLKGKWKKGNTEEKTLIFHNGLEYVEKNWKYCKNPDRRFCVEHDEGLKPAPLAFLTAELPSKVIPPGFYDPGYGFYDTKDETVYKYPCLHDIKKIPGPEEKAWIESNCRYAPDNPVGPCDFYYEEWLTPGEELELPPPPNVCTKKYAQQKEKEEEELLYNQLEAKPSSRWSTFKNRRMSFRPSSVFKDFYLPSSVMNLDSNSKAQLSALLSHGSHFSVVASGGPSISASTIFKPTPSKVTSKNIVVTSSDQNAPSRSVSGLKSSNTGIKSTDQNLFSQSVSRSTS